MKDCLIFAIGVVFSRTATKIVICGLRVEVA